VKQEKVSAAVSTYINNGFMDILQNKWFSDLPCVNRELETSDIGQPTPLGVDAFLGVFLMLGCGILAGAVILCLEHAFYHYALPKLRQKPPDSIWRNQNMMFVSQVCRSTLLNPSVYCRVCHKNKQRWILKSKNKLNELIELNGWLLYL